MIRMKFNSNFAGVAGDIRKPKTHSIVGTPSISCPTTDGCATAQTCNTICNCN